MAPSSHLLCQGLTLVRVMRRLSLPAHPLATDAAIAIGLTALSLVIAAAGARDIGAVDGASLLLIVLQTMPLVVRRVWPVPVWIVTLSATAAHLLFSEALPASVRATLGGLIALFSVSERYERRLSIWAYLAQLVAIAAIVIYRTGFPAGLGAFVQAAVSTTVAWVLGTWARERGALTQLAEERAAAAERSRDLEAHRAVAEERERIARELHDVVTHHVSVMVIQAEAAESALQQQPAAAGKAVAAIASTGRQALADMRTMLGVLGPPPAAGEDGEGHPPATEPMPGLDRLGDLIESVRTAGLSVELSITGKRSQLHPGIELSAYRIIQEALTNTLRHARGSRARVALDFASDAVSVTVTDDGGADEPDGEVGSGGRGLIGMRERVAMFGGEFDAGPIERGFRVRARLPLTLGGRV